MLVLDMQCSSFLEMITDLRDSILLIARHFNYKGTKTVSVLFSLLFELLTHFFSEIRPMILMILLTAPF